MTWWWYDPAVSPEIGPEDAPIPVSEIIKFLNRATHLVERVRRGDAREDFSRESRPKLPPLPPLPPLSPNWFR